MLLGVPAGGKIKANVEKKYYSPPPFWKEFFNYAVNSNLKISGKKHLERKKNASLIAY